MFFGLCFQQHLPQQAHQINAQHDGVQGRLRCPEVLHVEAVGGKIVFQFLDPVLTVGTATIDAPANKLSVLPLGKVRRSMCWRISITLRGLFYAWVNLLNRRITALKLAIRLKPKSRFNTGCRRAFKFDQLCALNFDQGR